MGAKHIAAALGVLVSIPVLTGPSAAMDAERPPAGTARANSITGLPPAHVRQALRHFDITVRPYRGSAQISAVDAIRYGRWSLPAIARHHPGGAWLVRFTDRGYGPVKEGEVIPIFRHRPAWLVQIRHADLFVSGPNISGLERRPSTVEGTLYVLIDAESGRFLTAVT